MVMILDDLEPEEEITPLQRKKALYWYKKMKSELPKGARMFFLGPFRVRFPLEAKFLNRKKDG